jgi:hypothetical protein
LAKVLVISTHYISLTDKKGRFSRHAHMLIT